MLVRLHAFCWLSWQAVCTTCQHEGQTRLCWKEHRLTDQMQVQRPPHLPPSHTPLLLVWWMGLLWTVLNC